MIVCFCNGLRESDVRAAARAGCNDVASCYASHGGQIQCGQCVCFAEAVIADVTAPQSHPLLAAE
jgi:bacterioferritin-associated ferredoxin